MNTGNFTDWHGNMLDIGPLYPFVGSEGLLVLLAVVFWIGWHVWQIRMEASNYVDDMHMLTENGNMARVIQGERILRPM